MAVIIKITDPSGRSLKITLDPYKKVSIGRSSRAMVKVKDETCSGTHVEVYLKDNIATVKDLGSKNGTLLNNHTITETYFYLDDKVSFGDTEFILCSESMNSEERQSHTKIDNRRRNSNHKEMIELKTDKSSFLTGLKDKLLRNTKSNSDNTETEDKSRLKTLLTNLFKKK